MCLLDDHLRKTSVLKTEIRFIEMKSNTKSMNNIIKNFHSLDQCHDSLEIIRLWFLNSIFFINREEEFCQKQMKGKGNLKN